MEWKCAKQYSAILNAACWVLTKIKNEAEFIVCQQEPHGSLTLSRSFAFQFCNSDLHFWHWCRCEPSVLNDQRGCSLHMLRAPATQKCFPCWLCYQGNILTRLWNYTSYTSAACLWHNDYPSQLPAEISMKHMAKVICSEMKCQSKGLLKLPWKPLLLTYDLNCVLEYGALGGLDQGLLTFWG